MRTTAERRYKTKMKQRRKVEIVRETFNEHSLELLDDKRYVGKLKKGKVHCSCPLCSQKTNRRKGTYDSGFKHSDQQKLARGKEE